MQFRHPEILYALLLLLIPIIIHLFQLRRFQKVDFTNVAFLKKATLQTRKSSKIKKWLTLLMRLLALACIILAFAQPFTATDKALNTEKETVLYIDNSYSMQAKGPNGPLLIQALQGLYKSLQGEESLSWFTNNQTKKNISQNDLKNEVLELSYSHKALAPADVWLKAQQLFSNSETADKRLIWISDFQNSLPLPVLENSNIYVDVIQPQPVNPFNLSIDTAYIQSKKVGSLQLRVGVSGTGELPENTAVSLYNNNRLVAKTAAEFQGGKQTNILFDIENPDGFKGRIQLSDTQLQYDNELFFNMNPQVPIKVLSINQAEGNYLKRLFTNTYFVYAEQNFNQLNYNDLPAQNFIILNELEEIPLSLINALKAFQGNGGSLLIIPGLNLDFKSYNTLLNTLRIGRFTQNRIDSEKKITTINFSHPLFENVFEKQVANFQYPTVKSFYELQSSASEVLKFEDGRPFLVQMNNTFLATAAFRSENSNFTSSPLIVPTLLNMAQQSLPLPELYYNLDTANNFSIPVNLGNDQIVKLADSIQSVIPLQQSKAQSVSITVSDELNRAGTYGVFLDETALQYVSFNFPRKESGMSYWDLESWKGVTVHDSVDELFQTIAEDNEMNLLWKWFVIFAVLFLLFELFILKFL